MAYVFIMPTVHEEHGFAVRIFTADHPPPHVHVWKAGGLVRVGLDAGPDAVRAERVTGMADRDVVRAVRVVRANWRKLMDAWNAVHTDA